jgi:hypothetical protein
MSVIYYASEVKFQVEIQVEVYLQKWLVVVPMVSS